VIDLNQFPWLPAAIMVPLAGSVLALLFRSSASYIGAAVSLGLVLVAAGMAQQVSSQGVQVHFMGGWRPPLGIALQADGLSSLMILMTSVVGFGTSMYAVAYFRPKEGSEEAYETQAYFWPLWLFLFTALNGMFLSRDLFNLYITLELLGLSAGPLVALAGEARALRAAMRYLLVSMVGSLTYLLGVGLIYSNYSLLDMEALAGVIEPGPFPLLAISLMTIGLLMKTALFPMHFWLPPAHANAPAPVSAVLSALVVKGSFYILIRLWFQVFDSLLSPPVMTVLGLLGAFAIVWGAFQALQQRRLKLLVAYSTVAQLGYLFLLFPLAQQQGAAFTAWNGTFYFLIAHACAKAGMFLAAGNILHAFGHDRIRDMGEMTRYLPISSFAFGMAGISLVGLPPSGGFIGKWLLINASIANQQWLLAALIAVGSLLAAGYILRVLPCAFRHVPGMPPPKVLSPLTEWAALGLALAAVVLGLISIFPLGLLEIGSPIAGSLILGGVP
jgi:multicomponent Na+:H+ antiporter subunit D